MKKINCFVLNYAPHYRKEIFTLIDKNISCDFYFGDKTYGSISKIDYRDLNNFVHQLRFRKLFKSFYVLYGQISLAFKPYQNYIITGQPYNISSWILLFLNRILGRRTYIWNHGWYGDESKAQRILKKLQFTLANGYFTYGNYAKNIMISSGLEEHKIHVIYNSLNHSKQLKVRSNLVKTNIYKSKFKNEYPVLFFIGRLTAIKKLDLLIKAMKRSFLKSIYYNLIIIGDGDEKDSLLTLVQKLELDAHVLFFGKSYDEDKIGELIFNANLCVSPGNIGLTAIHSLSFGCPALTHNNYSKQMPEFEAIRQGVTGDYFEENNIESLSDAIENWLSKYPDKTPNQIQECYEVIDHYYNPKLQLKTLKRVLT